jgi:ADP-ribose pyrophosphatase YjhB (NUDIX family)
LIKEGHVLLVLKGKGPFEGLWDLPGGGIELDETAEVALQRELDEEVCLHYTKASFLTTVTYQLPWKGGTFQQLGVIFRVQEWKESENKIPHDLSEWKELATLSSDILTPLAKQALKMPRDKS